MRNEKLILFLVILNFVCCQDNKNKDNYSDNTNPYSNNSSDDLKSIKINNNKLFDIQVVSYNKEFKNLYNLYNRDSNSVYYIINCKIDSLRNPSGGIYLPIDDEKLLIDLIKELLKFQGDTRIVLTPVMKYGLESISNKSTKYFLPTDCSVQVQALHIINSLIFTPPYIYSPCPVLKNIKNNDIESIKGEMISEAYQCYKNWYWFVKKIGIKTIMKEEVYPLDNCKFIRWYLAPGPREANAIKLRMLSE